MPLGLVLSFDHHVDNLALKSLKRKLNYDFEKSMLLSVSSKPERKDSNSILLWLGDLYITGKYQFLFSIITSQIRHPGKDMMSTKRTAKDSL